MPSSVPLEDDELIPAVYQPEGMHCPYPVAEDAAYALRCGRGDACEGPVERVHVVGFSVSDGDVLDRLGAVSEAGGTTARFAADAAELRALLDALFEELAAR